MGQAKARKVVWYWNRSVVPLVLLLVSLIGYLGNARVIGSGDTLPARYLPVAILRHATFRLDDFPALYNASAMKRYAFGERKPYYLEISRGHYVSAYTPGPALLALPIYLTPVLAGMRANSPWLPGLEKLSASVITAFSVVFLFLALRELVAESWALVIAVIYAFGTSSLSVSSQALWQHGPSQFFIALAIYFLVKGNEEETYLPYAGFALGCAIVMRPTDALIALSAGLWIVHKHRHMLIRFVLLALPPLAFLAIYNVTYLGSIVGFHVARDPVAWSMPLLTGLAGLLFSPGRGLFIYSPIVLFSVAGIYRGWRSGDWLIRYLSFGLLFVVLLYSKWFMWWGGYTYGPRLLADLFPILCFSLYPLVEVIHRQPALVGAFALLALVSVGFNVLGAYYDNGSWNIRPDVNENQSRLWAWYDSPLVDDTRVAYYSSRAAYDRDKREVETVFRSPLRRAGKAPTQTPRPPLVPTHAIASPKARG